MFKISSKTRKILNATMSGREDWMLFASLYIISIYITARHKRISFAKEIKTMYYYSKNL